MEKNKRQLVLGSNDDENKNLKRNALEILDHFSDEEKERGIVIIVGGHDLIGMETAKVLAHAMADKHIVVAHTNSVGQIIISDSILETPPAPTMENLIQHISNDLKKHLDALSYEMKEYKTSEVSYKKEQEKRRRRHLHKKKISTRKKG